MADTIETIMSTQRLALRRFHLSDAPALQALCDNWDIARMTTRIPHPYTLDDAAAWIAGHEDALARERSYAITQRGTLIGAAGLIGKAVPIGRADRLELAYWLGEPWWGQGFATETAARLCRFGFEDLNAELLTAGYFAGNEASARVLAKCGFRHTGEEHIYSLSRDAEVTAMRLELRRADMPASLDRIEESRQ